MKRFLHFKLAVTLLLYLGLYSVSIAQKESIQLKGCVLDSITNEVLPFAGIEITPLSKTKKFERFRQVCDDNGQFIIALPIATSYKITASFIGKEMSPKIIPFSRVKMGATVRIKMQDNSNNLEEVSVVANKILVRLDADRIAYKVEDDPLSKSENLRDMLKRVPLVTVKGDGEIQVKGTTNFVIYLNGKPSKMISSNPKEILRGIPASTIKKIEVITDPGVKYDAEGVSTILNIVTKDMQLDGYNATVGLTGGIWQPFASPNLFFTTKIGKLGIITNYQYTYNNMLVPQELNTKLILKDREEISLMKTKKSVYQSHTGGLTLSYDFNPKNLLSISTNIMFSNTYQNKDVPSIQTLLDHTILEKRHQVDFLQIKTHSIESNIDFQHSTDLPNELLTLSYRYLFTPNRLNSSQDLSFLVKNSSPLTEPYIIKERSSSLASLHEHTAQIDYTRPFGVYHTLDVGIKTIFRNGGSIQKYQLFDPQKKNWIVGSINNKHLGLNQSPLRYTQTILGLYANYNFNWKKIALSSGIRAEKGFHKVLFTLLPQANINRTFLDIVPQVNFSYKLKDNQQIKLIYKYSVSRPNIEQISPFKIQVTNSLTVSGNPDVENAKIHKISLGYNKYSSKFTLMLSADFLYSNNMLAQITEQDKDDPSKLNGTWSNSQKSTIFGGNLFINYSPFTWWRIFLQSDVKYHILRSHKKETSSKEVRDWGGVASLSSVFTLPKQWNVNLNGGIYVQPPSLMGSSVWVPFHNISVSKAFLKNSLNLSAWLANPFYPKQTYKMYLNTSSFRQEYEVKNFAFSCGLSLSYSFGKMKSKVRKTKLTIKNNDVSKEKGGLNRGK